MSQKRVAIEITPHRIDLAVQQGGRIAARKRLPVALPSEPAEWPKALRNCGAALKEAVQELQIAGVQALVVYRSPTQSIDIVSYPVRSTAQALAAARLAAADALPQAGAAVSAMEIVGKDTSGDRHQTHVLFCAEREDISTAITSLVVEAGLQFASATPLDAVTLFRTATSVLRNKCACARLYVGEYSSFFVAGGAGTLLFARVVSLGVDALANALTRPLRISPGAEPIELPPATARAILNLHGIPDRAVVVNEQPRLTGGNVMPALQPVLQRLVVELRQSLRFGLSEEQRTATPITITGPGAAVKNLPALIGQELSLHVQADLSGPVYDSNTPASDAGELTGALASLPLLSRLNLRPSSLAAAVGVRRARRWLWSGAAAALVLIGFETFTTSAQLATTRKNADAIAQRAAGQEQLQLTADRLVNAINAGRVLEQRIHQELGGAACDHAVLQELSRMTPSMIRITNLSIRREAGKTHGVITGYAFTDTPGASPADLERFIDSLRGSVLFEQVTLGNVQIGALASRPGQSFEASFVAARSTDSLSSVAQANATSAAPVIGDVP